MSSVTNGSPKVPEDNRQPDALPKHREAGTANQAFSALSDGDVKVKSLAGRALKILDFAKRGVATIGQSILGVLRSEAKPIRPMELSGLGVREQFDVLILGKSKLNIGSNLKELVKMGKQLEEMEKKMAKDPDLTEADRAGIKDASESIKKFIETYKEAANNLTFGQPDFTDETISELKNQLGQIQSHYNAAVDGYNKWVGEKKVSSSKIEEKPVAKDAISKEESAQLVGIYHKGLLASIEQQREVGMMLSDLDRRGVDPSIRAPFDSVFKRREQLLSEIEGVDKEKAGAAKVISDKYIELNESYGHARDLYEQAVMLSDLRARQNQAAPQPQAAPKQAAPVQPPQQKTQPQVQTDPYAQQTQARPNLNAHVPNREAMGVLSRRIDIYNNPMITDRRQIDAIFRSQPPGAFIITPTFDGVGYLLHINNGQKDAVQFMNVNGTLVELSGSGEQRESFAAFLAAHGTNETKGIRITPQEASLIAQNKQRLEATRHTFERYYHSDIEAKEGGELLREAGRGAFMIRKSISGGEGVYTLFAVRGDPTTNEPVLNSARFTIDPKTGVVTELVADGAPIRHDDLNSFIDRYVGSPKQGITQERVLAKRDEKAREAAKAQAQIDAVAKEAAIIEARKNVPAILKNNPLYHGSLTDQEATALVKNKEYGTFILKESTKEPGWSVAVFSLGPKGFSHRFSEEIHFKVNADGSVETKGGDHYNGFPDNAEKFPNLEAFYKNKNLDHGIARAGYEAPAAATQSANPQAASRVSKESAVAMKDKFFVGKLTNEEVTLLMRGKNTGAFFIKESSQNMPDQYSLSVQGIGSRGQPLLYNVTFQIREDGSVQEIPSGAFPAVQGEGERIYPSLEKFLERHHASSNMAMSKNDVDLRLEQARSTKKNADDFFGSHEQEDVEDLYGAESRLSKQEAGSFLFWGETDQGGMLQKVVSIKVRDQNGAEYIQHIRFNIVGLEGNIHTLPQYQNEQGYRFNSLSEFLSGYGADINKGMPRVEAQLNINMQHISRSDIEGSFEVLGLSKKATFSEVRKQYRQLSASLHTDKTVPQRSAFKGTDEEYKALKDSATAKYQAIVDAYKKLEEASKDGRIPS